MRSENVDKVDLKNAANNFSYQQRNNQYLIIVNHEKESPFHLHENDLIGKGHVAETATNIIAAKKPITDLLLCRYLYQKRINKNIATTYSYEVNFKTENVDDFFNNSCIKNDFENPVSSVDLKLKNVSQNHLENNDQIDHILNRKFHPKQQLKTRKSLTIIGCIFSFLNFYAIRQNQKQTLPDFLALNTLDLFEKILFLTEKYKQVQLYLRHNDSSKKYIRRTSKRPVRFIDQSNLYKEFVSLNSWFTHFGLPLKVQNLQQSDEMRLP